MTRLRLHGEFLLSYTQPDRKGGWVRQFANGVTNAGVNYLLNGGFRGGARSPTWYVGLINDAGFSTLALADTLALHPGWPEFPYFLVGSVPTQTRPPWNPLPENAGLMASATASVGSITQTGTIRGAFLCNVASGIGSGTSVLYATGTMDAGLAVAAGGSLSVTYAVRLR